MRKDRVITVYGREDKGEGARAGLFDYAHELRYGSFQVKVSQLKKQIDEFLRTMKEIVDTVPHLFGDLELDAVSFTLEVSTKGTVRLLGTGGEAGGKGGLTFTLRRVQKTQ